MSRIDLTSPEAQERIAAVQSRVARAGIASVDVTPPMRGRGVDCSRLVVEVAGREVEVVVGGEYFVGVANRVSDRPVLGAWNAAALRLLADELDRLPGGPLAGQTGPGAAV
ncbi:MAG TPA: hypothetical protein VIC82_03640 [Candidatus Nanopelagicales bacterium]